MDQIARVWKALSAQRKALVIGGAAALLFLMVVASRIAMEPPMALLYGGLDPKAAGDVTAALEQLGVATEIRGGSIYVPENERDRVRLDLARQGLPAQGQAGYELLDNLSGFGTTSEMFQAAYWRAKEGELARTILATPGVQSARVHIGSDARRPFQRAQRQATAAVTVRTSGGPLSESAALSIRYLVALAVAEIDPAQVAVIDAQHGVILRPGDERTGGVNSAEGDRRAERIEMEIEELLGVRVGPNNIRVSVTVETTTETQTISERILDPESQVTMSAETQARNETSTGGASAVTVASNLPDGDAAAGAGGESSAEETTERVAYQYSETRRDQVVQPGAVKRIGVAVLVNEETTIGADGAVETAPRSDQELAAIEELVKSAIAFDAARGDVVTVESMRFAPLELAGETAEASFLDTLMSWNLGGALQILVLGIVALLLGLFVVRPILASAAAAPAEIIGADLGSAMLGAPKSEMGAKAAIGADDPAALTDAREEDIEAALALGDLDTPEALQAAEEAGLPAEAVAVARLRATSSKRRVQIVDEDDADQPISMTTLELLRDLAAGKRDETVQLLKKWLHTGDPEFGEARK